MENVADQIASELLKIKAVKLSLNPPFTWTSGMKTPIYTDNRLIISFPESRQKVIEGFKQVIQEENIEFDVIAGTATAAVPFAAFLAWNLNKPMVYIRHKKKDYGASKQIEGTMQQGARVLIIEDLISTGGSAIRSIEACKNEYNAEVVGVLSIFTYEMQKAKDNFLQSNAKLWSLCTFSSLIKTATKLEYISEEDTQKVLSWSADPDGWYDSINR